MLESTRPDPPPLGLSLDEDPLLPEPPLELPPLPLLDDPEDPELPDPDEPLELPDEPELDPLPEFDGCYELSCSFDAPLIGNGVIPYGVLPLSSFFSFSSFSDYYLPPAIIKLGLP